MYCTDILYHQFDNVLRVNDNVLHVNVSYANHMTTYAEPYDIVPFYASMVITHPGQYIEKYCSRCLQHSPSHIALIKKHTIASTSKKLLHILYSYTLIKVNIMICRLKHIKLHPLYNLLFWLKAELN